MQSKQNSRSRKGCMTCRSRKVKCDENRAVCNQCSRLSLECIWNSANATQGSRSMASASAIVHPIPAGPGPSSGQDLHRDHKLYTLVAAYFRSIHPYQANGFIHQATLERSIAGGTADPLTIKAICAVSARYLESNHDSGSPDGGEQAAQWTQEVKNALMADTDRLGYSKLVAALCLTQHELASGRNASAWIMCSLAVRFALAMGLNTESDNAMPRAEQEYRRRLMWAAFSSDCICHGGLDDYTLLSPSTIRIPLPAAEYTYSMSLPNPTPCKMQDVESPPQAFPLTSDGLMSRYVRLMAMRSTILKNTKNVESHNRAWEAGSLFERSVQSLRHWSDTLPLELRFTIDNMHGRRISNELGAFVLLHMWYDHLHCIVYHIALAGFEEAASAAYLSSAPEGWVDKVRTAYYLRACALRQKFALLNQQFPSYIPENWQYATIALEMTRNLLQYFSVVYPLGLPDDQHKQALQGFEDMITVVSRMAKTMHGVNIKLKDLVWTLTRHGFQISSTVWEHSVQHMSGAATPPRGPILSRLPMFRRHLRYPDVEGSPQNEKQGSPDAIDPISNEVLSSGLPFVPEGTSPIDVGQLRNNVQSDPLAGFMTPTDYLSWLPNQQPVRQDDIFSTLWGSFSGDMLPEFGLNVANSTWDASGHADGDSGETSAWFHP